MQKSASLRKGRGDIRHNRRDIIAGSCYEDRIQDNVVLADYDIKDVYHILFDEVVEDYNSTQKRSDRKIKDYYSKINNDKKTNPFHEVIVTDLIVTNISQSIQSGLIDLRKKMTR